MLGKDINKNSEFEIKTNDFVFDKIDSFLSKSFFKIIVNFYFIKQITHIII